MTEAVTVVVTLRLHTLPRVAERVAPHLGEHTAVVSAQPGLPWWYFHRHGGAPGGIRVATVDPGGIIARAIDPNRVVGCVVYPSTSVVSPGVVRHEEGERFSLGELDGTPS